MGAAIFPRLFLGLKEAVMRKVLAVCLLAALGCGGGGVSSTRDDGSTDGMSSDVPAGHPLDQTTVDVAADGAGGSAVDVAPDVKAETGGDTTAETAGDTTGDSTAETGDTLA